MMEIKCYKSTLITLHFIFLTWGPTCPGAEFLGGRFSEGRIVQFPLTVIAFLSYLFHLIGWKNSGPTDWKVLHGKKPGIIYNRTG